MTQISDGMVTGCIWSLPHVSTLVSKTVFVFQWGHLPNVDPSFESALYISLDKCCFFKLCTSTLGVSPTVMQFAFREEKKKKNHCSWVVHSIKFKWSARPLRVNGYWLRSACYLLWLVLFTVCDSTCEDACEFTPGMGLNCPVQKTQTCFVHSPPYIYRFTQ